MATNQIQFTGINRAVSDYSNTGACEELIGLRPTNTGLAPVKNYSTQMNDTTYCKVYEHNVGSQVNYIGVSKNYSFVTIDQIRANGTRIAELLPSIEVGAAFSIDSIHVATTGNILTISISDEATKLYLNYAFRWRSGSYEPLEANVPSITPTITLGTPTKKYYRTADYFAYVLVNNTSAMSEYISTAFSAIQQKNPTFCFGPCILAIAFKTIDGDTFWTGQWYPINPVQDVNYSLSGSSDNYHMALSGTTYSPSYASNFPNTLAVNGSAYLAAYMDDNSAVNHRLAGCTVTVSLPAISGWNKNTSTLKAVEIYVSRPVIYQDYSFSKANPEFGTVDSTTNLALPELPAKEMNLGGQLLYLQKSIELTELTSSQTVNLRFGGEAQVTDKTLEVDPGMITRTGKMLAYNNRYHFYDSVKRTYLGVPKFANRSSGTATSTDVFVTYESDTIKTQVYVGTANIVKTGGNATAVWNLVTAPTLNIRTVTILYQAQGYYFIKDYAMNESSAYNYSICDSGEFARERQTNDASDEEVVKLLALKATPVTYIDEKEATAINVSEQYNPFVFRVGHSYLAPGAVLDLQPQLMAVADISIGDAPLDVFTAKGVYALLQGDGTVLYGAFRALSNLISSSNSASTDAGTFFFASGGLWRIAGLRAELVSDALSLGPHKEVRSAGPSNAYKALANTAANTYDISPYESAVSFEEFTNGASLSYNRYRDEVIVSNKNYSYSYVLSLKYLQWFKIEKALRQEVVGSDIAIVDYGTLASPGSKAKVILILRDLGEGDLIQISIYADLRQTVVIAYYEHRITAAERQAILNSNYDLVRDSIISEWNASQDEMMSKFAMAAEPDPDPNPAPTSYRYVSFTVRDSGTIPGIDEMVVEIESEDNPDTNGAFILPYDIVNFSDELETGTLTVHLQSRPLSYGYQYAHIHRVVDMVRSSLVKDLHNLTVALYGSDNLHDWTLLTYANRKCSDATHPLHISQIRTSPAGRSWRYYTITIGGIIPIDTDFGPVLLDYEPVIRRIG